MKEIPITDLIKKYGRKKTADMIGCHLSNISNIINGNRKVYAVLDDNGVVRCYEIKDFPNKNMSRKSPSYSS